MILEEDVTYDYMVDPGGTRSCWPRKIAEDKDKKLESRRNKHLDNFVETKIKFY